VLYGGVGKDWLFDGKNKERLSWHAAIGYYIVLGDDNQDFTVGFCVAETPVERNGALNLDLTYSYFFDEGGPFGFFAGAAFGVSRMKDVFESDSTEFPGKFLWDIHVGLSFKLWADD